ncbi:helix-turn-helix domain-containing protein [Candidatus Bathyarchaeota archaeon]|nr:helix-turn-helix domain-containing protein [Candidatus Bathyarchaeota archaeon]
MTYQETGNEKTAETILKEAGFTVSQKCCCRPSCFDFAARKNRTLIFIKIQQDIGNISPSDPMELAVISEHISAVPLLISEKTREKPLEDDTVYSRYNIMAVSQMTFENIVLRKVYPLIQAGPGGYYVEIDGEAIMRRRQELGLSIGELAEKIGISRRTIYGYERGMAKASVSAAYNLIYILGIPVAKSVNLFEKSENQPKCLLTKARRVIIRNRLLQKIFDRLAHYDFAVFKKAPFDFLINAKKEKMKIIGAVVDKKERELDRRVDEVLSVSRVVQACPILITEGQNPSSRDILCIHSDELSEIKKPEDLITSFI